MPSPDPRGSRSTFPLRDAHTPSLARIPSKRGNQRSLSVTLPAVHGECSHHEQRSKQHIRAAARCDAPTATALCYPAVSESTCRPATGGSEPDTTTAAAAAAAAATASARRLVLAVQLF